MGYDKHCQYMDVLQCKVADKFCLNDGTDVCEECAKVMYQADGCAHSDGGLDLAKVCLGFTQEFLGFMGI